MTRPESMTNPWRVVVITGAQGFVGQSLARTLIAWMRGLDSTEGAIDQLRDAQLDEPRHPSVPRHLLLIDIGPRPSWCPDDDPRIQWISGDLSDPSVVRGLIDHDVTGVFHLAGIVSGAAEADFDKGLRVNFDATRELAMAIAEPHRGQAGGRKTESPVSPALPLARSPVRFIHTSSIAVYGVPLPLHIDDHTQPWPSLSYGAQKLACELLLADMSRRGMLDSLSLRLSGVVMRPALPNGALSAFNSDLIRETLAGRPIVSPVSALATLWLQSIEITVRNLIHAMGLRGAAPDGQRTVLLPAVAASVQDIIEAVSLQAGRDVSELVEFRPNPAIEPMFGRWPRSRAYARAQALGFGEDASLADIIAAEARRLQTA
jgi:nucleoside-diphosphate-sugar epimerase